MTLTLPPPSRVQSDFDTIARLQPDHGPAPGRYDDWVIRHLPANPTFILDVGCGAGRLAQRLAWLSPRVTAVDLSPEMLALARANHDAANIQWVRGDAFALPLPRAAFDAVVSVATLHHMPLTPALERLASLLRPGGRLVVVDLIRSTGLVQRAWDLAAMAAVGLEWASGRRKAPSKALESAWRRHGAGETYLTMSEIRRRAHAVLPGAKVRRLLHFRYGLVWTKDATSPRT